MIGALRVIVLTYRRLLSFYQLNGEFCCPFSLLSLLSFFLYCSFSFFCFPLLFSPCFFVVLRDFFAGYRDLEWASDFGRIVILRARLACVFILVPAWPHYPSVDSGSGSSPLYLYHPSHLALKI